MCGEGVPDFYAKSVDSKYCISAITDKILGPVMKKLHICTDIESFDLKKDENGDPLIEDCKKNALADYYLTKQSIASFGAFFGNKNGL